jgi:hypothetical protein
VVVHVGTGNFPHWGIPRTNRISVSDRLNKMFAYDLLGTGENGESKNKNELTSVVVRGLPAFDSTTVRSFSSSQVSIVSIYD